MKVKFIGVPGEKHQSIEQYGFTFELGKWVDVPDNFTYANKLRNHPHFQVQGETKREAPEALTGHGVDGSAGIGATAKDWADHPGEMLAAGEAQEHEDGSNTGGTRGAHAQEDQGTRSRGAGKR